MAKIRIKIIEAALATIQKEIADCRADIAAEKEAAGEDGSGSGLGAKTLEERDQPAMDDPENPVTNGNQLVGAKDAHGLAMKRSLGKDADLARRLMENAPAQDGLDTRRKGLKHIPYTEGVASLHSIPGFDRVK